jgi:hypothetical protein
VHLRVPFWIEGLERSDAAIVRDHHNAGGEPHIAPNADQIGFRAELREAREDTPVSDHNPISASAPDAQAKTAVPQYEARLIDHVGNADHRP